jgi:hypothetical protein
MKHTRPFSICFTTCLCISPDFDGYQGNKNETSTPRGPRKDFVAGLFVTLTINFHDMFVHHVHGMFHGMFVYQSVLRRSICFTICLCISPDLDGNRGTKK